MQIQLHTLYLYYMYISVDIGGTNTRIASSFNLKDVVSFETFPSEQNLDTQKAKIKQTIELVSKGENVKAYAVGIAGIIDKENCRIRSSPNYKILDGVGVHDLLGVGKNVSLFCLNDTKMAGLGEANLGAGSLYDSVAYLALGTGVGGTIINNKKIDEKSYEPGHQIVNFDAKITDGLGLTGTYEMYASGTAFFNKYKLRPHECKDPAIWAEYGNNVGVGILNLILMWSPDCIVIGGGMSKYFDEFMPTVRDYLKNLNVIDLPPIVKAEFGQGSGIVGGFVYLSLQGYKS